MDPAWWLTGLYIIAETFWAPGIASSLVAVILKFNFNRRIASFHTRSVKMSWLCQTSDHITYLVFLVTKHRAARTLLLIVCKNLQCRNFRHALIRAKLWTWGARVIIGPYARSCFTYVPSLVFGSQGQQGDHESKALNSDADREN